MSFFILRRGQKLGPFPDGAVEEMSSSGQLRAGDLVCAEGDQNWLPVGRFLELRERSGQSPDADATVPEVQAAAAVPGQTEFVRQQGGAASEAELSDAERQVIGGGRYLIFEYCWSLGISFRRTSRPILVRAGEDGAAAALRYSLVSALLGWWGIPGPLWAIATLRHNARGGQDATLETLTKQVGHARAAAACARRRAGAPPSALMRALGGMMTALSLAICLGVAWVMWGLTHGESEQATGPGAKEFTAAYRLMVGSKRSAVFANDAKALELADRFNKNAIEAYLTLARINASVGGFETNKPAVITYCEWHQDRVVFLLLAPGLHKLPAALRRTFAEQAWRNSSESLTESKLGFAGLRVAVAVGSVARFDHVLMGRYVRDFELNNTGLKSHMEGHQGRSRLYPLFVPLAQLESWKDE